MFQHVWLQNVLFDSCSAQYLINSLYIVKFCSFFENYMFMAILFPYTCVFIFCICYLINRGLMEVIGAWCPFLQHVVCTGISFCCYLFPVVPLSYTEKRKLKKKEKRRMKAQQKLVDSPMSSQAGSDSGVGSTMSSLALSDSLSGSQMSLLPQMTSTPVPSR